MKNIFSNLKILIFIAIAKFLRADGSEGKPASVAWSTDRPDILILTPTADGLGCKIQTTGVVGLATITVTADADPSEGISNIILTEQIQIVEAMVVTGQVSLGEPVELANPSSGTVDLGEPVEQPKADEAVVDNAAQGAEAVNVANAEVGAETTAVDAGTSDTAGAAE